MRKVIEILEKDCKKTPEEIAAVLGRDVKVVEEQIKQLEDSGVIAGYKALINWDAFDRDLVVAQIELRVTPQLGKGFDRIAEKIYQFPHVTSMFLMSGGYDLCLTIEGQNMKDVALFVAEKLAPMECIESTTTHFILKKYKEQGVIYEQDVKDNRQVIAL